MGGNTRLITPVRITVVESIIDQFVTQIREGNLKPNDKLPSERELIDQLGVSRSSVREALQSLAAMGLVEIRQGKGAYIRARSPYLNLNKNIELHPRVLQKEMRYQLNEARLVLEEGIVSLAAQKVNQDDKQRLTQALEGYYTIHGKSSSIVDEWEKHDRIHLTIASIAGNPFLEQILRTLLDTVPDHLREKGAKYGSVEEVEERQEIDRNIHKELCEAVLRGDEEAARQWMQKHALQEEQIIGRYYIDQTIIQEG